MKRAFNFSFLIVGSLTLLLAGAPVRAHAAPLQRMAADFQNNTTVGGNGEIETTATPASGGLLVYQKTLSIPFEVVYITFSAQGDAHNGSALLMQAAVDDAAGNETICQPMAGQTGLGGGGPTVFPGWMTLLKLPELAPAMLQTTVMMEAAAAPIAMTTPSCSRVAP